MIKHVTKDQTKKIMTVTVGKMRTQRFLGRQFSYTSGLFNNVFLKTVRFLICDVRFDQMLHIFLCFQLLGISSPQITY